MPGTEEVNGFSQNKELSQNSPSPSYTETPGAFLRAQEGMATGQIEE